MDRTALVSLAGLGGIAVGFGIAQLLKPSPQNPPSAQQPTEHEKRQSVSNDAYLSSLLSEEPNSTIASTSASTSTSDSVSAQALQDAPVLPSREEPLPEDEPVKLPFPQNIVDVLRSTSLAYLATSKQNVPHLSLMNFTYFKGHAPQLPDASAPTPNPAGEKVLVDDECVILSTRIDTTKFTDLVANKNVALLVHGFDTKKADHTDQEGTLNGFSVTLNGTATVLPRGDCSDFFRSIHLANNPKNEQFINGENIAIIRLEVQSAKICDVQDRVSVWTRKAISP